MSDQVRSFIAVPVSPEAAALLAAAQEVLRRADPTVKWVDPDGFHITLKFLGSVAHDRLQEIWQSVTRALPGATAFTMRFRGAGAFPNPNRARVVWAGVAQGAAELTALASQVEQACLAHGFAPESRPFHPHLTLGRARQPGPNPELFAAIAALEQEDLGEVQVDRVVLMRSELTPRGPIYHVLQDHPLS